MTRARIASYENADISTVSKAAAQTISEMSSNSERDKKYLVFLSKKYIILFGSLSGCCEDLMRAQNSILEIVFN